MTEIKPNVELLGEFKLWLSNNASKKTVYQYIKMNELLVELKIPYQNKEGKKVYCFAKSVSEYFSHENLSGRNLKINAFRSYLKFLCFKKLLTRGDLMEFLDAYKRKRRTNGHSDRVWSVPKNEWASYINKSQKIVAKMGLWIGFNFGLRLGEIINLRIQDLDFKKQLILIRGRDKDDRKNQLEWNPKYNRNREIPFKKVQASTFRRWINETRPKDLDHNYLLFTPTRINKGSMLNPRNFQRMCSKVGLHPHVLRYSFATNFYGASKDIKLTSAMLGHANASTTSDYLQLGVEETMNKARSFL